jgi:hypothetical protein
VQQQQQQTLLQCTLTTYRSVHDAIPHISKSQTLASSKADAARNANGGATRDQLTKKEALSSVFPSMASSMSGGFYAAASDTEDGGDGDDDDNGEAKQPIQAVLIDLLCDGDGDPTFVSSSDLERVLNSRNMTGVPVALLCTFLHDTKESSSASAATQLPLPLVNVRSVSALRSRVLCNSSGEEEDVDKKIDYADVWRCITSIVATYVPRGYNNAIAPCITVTHGGVDAAAAESAATALADDAKTTSASSGDSPAKAVATAAASTGKVKVASAADKHAPKGATAAAAAASARKCRMCSPSMLWKSTA